MGHWGKSPGTGPFPAVPMDDGLQGQRTTMIQQDLPCEGVSPPRSALGEPGGPQNDRAHVRPCECRAWRTAARIQGGPAGCTKNRDRTRDGSVRPQRHYRTARDSLCRPVHRLAPETASLGATIAKDLSPDAANSFDEPGLGDGRRRLRRSGRGRAGSARCNEPAPSNSFRARTEHAAQPSNHSGTRQS
jgi:hypothetical protein